MQTSSKALRVMLFYERKKKGKNDLGGAMPLLQSFYNVSREQKSEKNFKLALCQMEMRSIFKDR